ncbi:MAG: alpha/beta fold hydrolase, partial [Burkholderiales bacterium]|nr:alpha/beta fold hydrolase [Burkholderiales bacterium]
MPSNTTVDLDNLFAQIETANKEWFGSLVAKNITITENDSNTFVQMYQKFFDNTKLYLEAQQKFYTEQIAMWQHFFYKDGKNIELESHKPPFDKRFTDKEWETNPFFAYLKRSYLTMSQYLVEAIGKSSIDDEAKQRIEFFMRQYLDAISPTNFAFTNPEVIKSVVETGGTSLVEGMKNMVEDMHNGYISMTDESLYKIGDNIATTEGKVVFRNQLIELIQYTPKIANVYSIPLLIVPPCINKYYILDLQEKNSFVKYLVECGYTVFLVSWKSADQSMRTFCWEEYVEFGVIKSVDVILDITKADKINTLGYCIGGIILTTAYLVMKNRGIATNINTISCLTTMLDHAQPGDIRFFIDRDLMALKNITKNNGGIMSGRTISQIFSALRANELIWNYWVNNYLLGKTPQPFDILFWNN